MAEYEQILCELAGADPSIVVLDAGLATSMKTHTFQEAHPTRYFNLGIAEQNAVGVASGLARRGFVPLLHTFSNFLSRRAHDQIALSVAWPGCKVKLIAGSCGVFDGRNGPSHMAIDDLAAMSALPNMLVIEPGDQRQTYGLMRRAIAHDGPAYLRLRRLGAPPALLPGTADDAVVHVVQRNDAARGTLVIGGSLLEEGLVAYKILARRGVPLDVIHIAVLKPLDAAAIIDSARRTGLVFTMENHVVSGGFGDAVARAVGPLGVRHLRWGLPDEFIPAGDSAWQLAYCGLDAVSVAYRIEASLNEGQRHV